MRSKEQARPVGSKEDSSKFQVAGPPSLPLCLAEAGQSSAPKEDDPW